MISVIMPVTLQDYPGAAKNRTGKFITAVNSFIDQFNIEGHELIIVSDGCKEAQAVYEEKFTHVKNIQFFLLPKQELFSGYPRHFGISKAKNKWMSYLDSDDMFGCHHLAGIAKGIRRNPDAEWLYWNEILDWPDQPAIKEVSIAHGSIGTSSIAHRKNVRATWENCNGYGHDWLFISQLDILKSIKIEGTCYHIRHIKDIFDA